MKGTKAATRYAQALLELAVEQNQLEQVYADMVQFNQAVNDTKEFQVFLNSPVINSDKKKEVLNSVFTEFSSLSLSFIGLVTKKQREGLLPFVASSFVQLYKTHKGIVEVTVYSASQLDAAVKDQIIAKIRTAVTGEIELTEKINADLIGGFVVEMGDTRVDASVASQLNNLKQRLTR